MSRWLVTAGVTSVHVPPESRRMVPALPTAQPVFASERARLVSDAEVGLMTLLQVPLLSRRIAPLSPTAG